MPTITNKKGFSITESISNTPGVAASAAAVLGYGVGVTNTQSITGLKTFTIGARAASWSSADNKFTQTYLDKVGYNGVVFSSPVLPLFDFGFQATYQTVAKGMFFRFEGRNGYGGFQGSPFLINEADANSGELMILDQGYGTLTNPGSALVVFSRNYFFVRQNIKSGFGVDNPTEKVEVAGNVKATAFIGDGSQLTGIGANAGSPLTLFSGTTNSPQNVTAGTSYYQNGIIAKYVGSATTSTALRLDDPTNWQPVAYSNTDTAKFLTYLNGSLVGNDDFQQALSAGARVVFMNTDQTNSQANAIMTPNGYLFGNGGKVFVKATSLYEGLWMGYRSRIHDLEVSLLAGQTGTNIRGVLLVSNTTDNVTGRTVAPLPHECAEIHNSVINLPLVMAATNQFDTGLALYNTEISNVILVNSPLWAGGTLAATIYLYGSSRITGTVDAGITVIDRTSTGGATFDPYAVAQTVKDAVKANGHTWSLGGDLIAFGTDGTVSAADRLAAGAPPAATGQPVNVLVGNASGIAIASTFGAVDGSNTSYQYTYTRRNDATPGWTRVRKG